MNIEQILWSNLIPSPRNVRKVKAGIDSLAASIAADGLLQNLTVIPAENGKYEVVAGERRRRAIVRLVKAKTWANDATVPCVIRQPEEATFVSYTENAERVAMHPADAIRAFATMAEDGHTEEAIAHRYGYDPREVRKMLALAALSPKVLRALAADKIDVETAQALTLTDDHARQDRVLKNARTAYEVRRHLTDTKIATSHRLFRLIGIDAYQREGGTITRDLFADEGDGYADDSELLHRLVDEALNAAQAEAEAEGWAEVIAAQNTPYESYNWHRLYPDDEASFSAGAKAEGRMLITIGHHGELERTHYTRKARRSSVGDTATPLPRPLYSAPIVEDLSLVRTAALQVAVASRPHIANAALLDVLLPMVAGSGYHTAHAVQLRCIGLARPPLPEQNLRTLPSVFDPLADTVSAMPDDPAARFDWLLTLDPDTTQQMIAACTAALIDATDGKYSEKQRMLSADRIARAVDLDMTQHWEGSTEFYDRLPRKALLAALEEGRTPAAAENCAKMKKHELARAVTERLSGTGWLPPALLTPDTPIEVANDVEEIDEELDVDMLVAAE